jgi:hypothetical protein
MCDMKRAVVVSSALAALLTGWWFAGPSPGVGVDDAYIYFRYVENFVRDGELAYNPGERSAGVTGGVWFVLLVLWRLIYGGGVVGASKALGVLFLALAAGMTAHLGRRLTGSLLVSLAAGMAVACSPTLLRHAVSGMETLQNLALLLVVLVAFEHWGHRRPFALGFLSGLLAVSRPENLVLSPLLGLFLLASGRRERGSWRLLGAYCGGWLVGAGPWEAFLLLQTGHLLPTSVLGKVHFFAPGYGDLGLVERLDPMFRVWGASSSGCSAPGGGIWRRSSS